MNEREVILNNFNDMLNVVYNYIKDVINRNGVTSALQKNCKYINTSSADGDNIYSLEFYVNCDCNEDIERKILALRVVKDNISERIEFYSSDNYNDEIDDSEIEKVKEDEWVDLLTFEGYYIQTLFNIFNNIDSYLP